MVVAGLTLLMMLQRSVPSHTTAWLLAAAAEKW